MKSACEHVPEELAADRAAPRRRSDHGDRGRPEERPQRGGDADVVALVAPALEVATVAEREHAPRSTPSWSTRDVSKPASSNTRSIATFCGSTSATNSSNPGSRRVRREALEQPRPDPAAVQIVGDGERDLGARRIAQADVGRERDRPKRPIRDRRAPRAASPATCQSVSSAPSTVLRSISRRPVEAQVAAVRREGFEEGDQRGFVAGGAATRAAGRAVTQHDVLGEAAGGEASVGSSASSCRHCSDAGIGACRRLLRRTTDRVAAHAPIRVARREDVTRHPERRHP